MLAEYNKKSTAMPAVNSLVKIAAGYTGAIPEKGIMIPEIVFITTFPPRECGIATYSQDLVKALRNQFHDSFNIRVCPLESETEIQTGTDTTGWSLHTDEAESYQRLAASINQDPAVVMVLIQHEFGLFPPGTDYFQQFLSALEKPVIIVFHTVLSAPGDSIRQQVQEMSQKAQAIVVMTNTSKQLLIHNYAIAAGKITVIPHGTHLVSPPEKESLKLQYGLEGRSVLTTFGLLSSGKNIETTLEALPAIIQERPDVLFLIIGKTHPSVIKKEGESYRRMLEKKTAALGLQKHVQFINTFLPLPELLQYLQLTDIYLFTSKDPNQAVSGTFAYAMSCGCAVISTPIPHAKEVLAQQAGIIIDFENPQQLSQAVISLFRNEELKNSLSSEGLHKMASTAWENAAIAHGRLFHETSRKKIKLHYSVPPVNLSHLKRMTTDFGIIQFAVISQPDPGSGYTLDDNARALVVICQHFALTGNPEDIQLIGTYLRFIRFCQQPKGYFLNYVDTDKKFTPQNDAGNLSDANGRAVWALGYLISLGELLPPVMIKEAERVLQNALLNVSNIHSTRSMAFIIKGLSYVVQQNNNSPLHAVIEHLANRLVQMYRHEADTGWQWYESYLTYANAILPEALLCAWLATGNPVYKDIAVTSFDFLLTKLFQASRIQVISNKHWLHKADNAAAAGKGGEQPIDIAYTVLALSRFYQELKLESYRRKMQDAFDWFSGNNHLHQIMYNPCTGGCYDGLEENGVNLNQGAESVVSYLMARLTIEKFRNRKDRVIPEPLMP